MGIGNSIGVGWGKVAMASGPVVNEAFEFTVKTDNAGTSASNQFTIPITSATPYNISTSDGQSITGATGATTLTFPSAGTYTVKIIESCRGWRFNGGGDRLKLLNISNWGVFQSTTSGTFRGASNMTCSATDAPINPQEYLSNCFRDCINFDGAIGNWDVSQVARFDFSFYQASNFNQPLADWDVSNGQQFGFMFDNTAFNQSIGNWNTSNALDMQGMFTNGDFNQNIDSWDVSNVTNMYAMFKNNTVFNQPLNSWNTSSVTNMREMFYISSFNQDISSWDVSNVTNFALMFNRNLVFNQPIGSWNVSSAIDMNGMFNSEYAGRNAFNQDLSSWDVSSVTNMTSMFGQSSFNQDISSWNVSSVTNMSNMFRKSLFNQPLNSWDVSNVTRMDGMLYDCQSFNQPLNNWNTSAVTNMNGMLMAAYSFDQDISTWDINQVTNFGNFGGYGPFSMTLSTANYDALLVAWEAQVPQNNISITFGASKYSLGSAAEAARTSLINTYGWTITDGGGIFYPMIISVDTTLGDGLDNYTLNFNGSTYDVSTSDGQNIIGNTGPTTITFPSAGVYDISITGTVTSRSFINDLKLVDIKQWGSINTSLAYAFGGANSLTTITAPDQPQGLNLVALFRGAQNFAGGISHWNTSGVTNMAEAFYNTSFDEDISSWDVSNVTSMSGAFRFTSFNNGGSPGINNWNTSNVTNMVSIFNANNVFNQPVGGWDVSNVTQISNAFFQATSFNQPLDTWNVSNVTSFSNIFNSATSFNQDISSWNVINCTDFTSMFSRAYSFNQPIGSWNTSSATSMNSMFDAVNGVMSFNQDISSWNVSGVTGMSNMFRNCRSFDQPLSSWNTGSLQSASQTFFECNAFDFANVINWDIVDVTNFTNFMYQVPNLLTQTYDAILVSWEAQLQAAYPGGVGYTPTISISFNGSTYSLGSAAETARTSLINTFGWTITDGGSESQYLSSLVASYNFDSDFTDYTGNHPLTPSGSTPPTAGVSGGVVNNCAEFNSSADYTLTADSDDFSFTDGVSDLPFSISFWANFDFYNSSEGAWFFSKRGDSTNTEYQILNSQNEFIVALFSGGNNSNVLNARLSYPPPIRTWHHYAVTYDGSATFAGIKLYIDGVSQTLTDNSFGTYVGMVNGTQDLNIGSRSWDPANGSFWGKMDETHIWKNRELTAAEVLDIYNTENSGNSIL